MAEIKPEILAFATEANKNRVTIKAYTLELASIAAGESKEFTIGLPADEFNEPESIKAVACVSCGATGNIATCEAGVMYTGTELTPILSVRVHNVGTTVIEVGANVHVIVVGQ